MIGQTISHYRITEELGQGGMGVVYLAEDSRLHCQRALKFLPTEVDSDSPELARLINEARALAALEHPNICPVQEIGEHEGQTYIVMSYLEGQTLKDRMADGPIPIPEAVEIARQVSSGLAAAHAKGIVHRDVKPDNVMLTDSDNGTAGSARAVLMDFGIAKNEESTLATRTGSVMGTMAYMSPEQAQGRTVEASTDVWAVGVLLYEMVAGRRPFAGDFEAAVLFSIVHSDPAPLGRSGQGCPASVERIIGKALAKDQEDRYGDGAALLDDLDRAIEGDDVAGRPLKKSHRIRLAGITAAAIAIVLLTLFWWPGILAPSDAISKLAVMPFEDRNDDPEQDYFAAGIADELAAGLRKVKALTIVSRNSAANARESVGTNREIGEKLGVDALIEGSVQRDGDRVKVSVHLVAADDDRLIWSESYTKDLRDVLNLQGEIALAVSAALEKELSPGEEDRLTRERQIDPEAFEAYLLGKFYYGQTTAGSTERARAQFERALELEPDWALAHVEWATNIFMHQQMAGLPASSIHDTLQYHAQKAMELDPDLAVCYALQAGLDWDFEWDLPAAGLNYARARELDPNMNMMDYAQYLNVVGRHQDALEQALHAVRVDPLDSFFQCNLGFRYLIAGRTRESLEEYAKVQERDPDYWLGYWGPGLMEITAGNPERAVELLGKAVALSDPSPAVQPDYALALIQAGREEEAKAILEEFEKKSAREYVSPFYLGQLYAAFGRKDDAFAAYHRAVDEKEWLMFWISPRINPITRGLVDDPRWPELVARIGFSTE